MASAKKAARAAARAKVKAERKYWMPIMLRRHKLQSQGILTTYHVTKPEITEGLTVEEFGEAGLLTY